MPLNQSLSNMTGNVSKGTALINTDESGSVHLGALTNGLLFGWAGAVVLAGALLLCRVYCPTKKTHIWRMRLLAALQELLVFVIVISYQMLIDAAVLRLSFGGKLFEWKKQMWRLWAYPAYGDYGQLLDPSLSVVILVGLSMSVSFISAVLHVWFAWKYEKEDNLHFAIMAIFETAFAPSLPSISRVYQYLPNFNEDDKDEDRGQGCYGRMREMIKQREQVLREEHEKYIDKKSFKAWNVHMDFSRPLFVSIIHSVGVGLLTWAYVAHLTRKFTFTSATWEYWWYTAPVKLTLAAAFGKPFAAEADFWRYFIQNVEAPLRKTTGVKDKLSSPTKAAIIFRMVMSVFTNLFVPSLLLWTLPMVLMQAQDAWSFVQAVVATAYFPTLDDLPEEIEFKFYDPDSVEDLELPELAQKVKKLEDENWAERVKLLEEACQGLLIERRRQNSLEKGGSKSVAGQQNFPLPKTDPLFPVLPGQAEVVLQGGSASEHAKKG